MCKLANICQGRSQTGWTKKDSRAWQSGEVKIVQMNPIESIRSQVGQTFGTSALTLSFSVVTDGALQDGGEGWKFSDAVLGSSELTMDDVSEQREGYVEFVVSTDGGIHQSRLLS